MAGLDQLGEMPEKQREQQHLNVRAVHIGIRQDANLAVTQATEVGRVERAVWVNPDSYRNVMDLVVGKQPVALHLPGVEHLAAQRQNGLAFFVTPHLGAATGRVALHQKHLVVRQITALAVGQLTGQHRHTGALALLDFLPGLLPALRRLDRQLGQFFAIFHMLVEP